MKAPSLARMGKHDLGGRAANSPAVAMEFPQSRPQGELIATHQDAAPPATGAPSPAKPRPPSWQLAQVIIRMPREKRRRLHQLAISLDKTAQDVMLEALDAYLAAKGMRAID